MRGTLPSVGSSSVVQGSSVGEEAEGSPPSSDRRRGAAFITWDQDIPPVTACAHCGDPNCEGCAPGQTWGAPGVANESGAPPLIAWETTSSPFTARLTSTARTTALEAQRFFGSLTPGSVWHPLVFAYAVESLAILSFSVLWILGLGIVFPRLTWEVLSTPSLLVIAAAIYVALVHLVVGLHAIAGLVLEACIGRTGKHPDYNRGIRMGLYSCGWDLLTSPVGIVMGLFGETPPDPLGLVLSGARVPRLAGRAYLQEARQLTTQETERTLRLTLVFFVSFLTLLVIGGSLGSIWWILG